MFQWDKTMYADFDSARIKLQYSFYEGAPKNEKIILFENLCSIANGIEIKKPEINEIIAYWNYRIKLAYSNSNPEIADSLKIILQSADSVRRPYNYLMLLSNYADAQPDVAYKYIMYKNLIDRFRQLGDSLQVGRMLTRLATLADYNIKVHENLPVQHWQYYRLAQNAFEGGKIENYRLKNLLNTQIFHENKETSDSIHKLLRESPLIWKDTIVYEAVLRNSFLKTDSIKFIDMNISMLENNPDYRNELGMNYVIKSNYKYRHRDFDESLRLAYIAKDIIDTATAPTAYVMHMFSSLSDSYEITGNSDSTLKYFKEYVFWRDSLEREINATALIGAEASVKLSEAESMRKLHHQKTKWVTGSVILVVIVIILSVSFIFYRNMKRREMIELRTKTELDKSRASLAAHTLILSEKERLLNNMEETLQRLQKENKISEPDVIDITKVMKMHHSDDIEREDFLEIHDKLHPDFIKNLKHDFPDLSESQLRLAAYIAIGLSTSHISRLLNIVPASVKTNRYRLRKKVGLSTTDSLEDFLRKYSG